MKKFWKMIKNQAAKTAEITMYEQIGKDFWSDEGISAKEFAADLTALGDVDEITLRINSPGGSLFEGLTIYNLLVAHKAKKIVQIDGLAASIASVIAMCGRVVMPENALMMIHDPHALVMGNSEEMRKMAVVLDKTAESLVSAYKAKCGKPEADIRNLMVAETWMNAKDAKEMGFCDEVLAPVKMAASFDLSKFRKAPQNLSLILAGMATPGCHDNQEMTPQMECSGCDMTEDCSNPKNTTAQTGNASSSTASAGISGNGVSQDAGTGQGAAAAAAKNSGQLSAQLKRKEIENMHKCKHCGMDLAEGQTCTCQTVMNAERTRVKDIRALGKKYNLSDLADEFIETGKTEQDFRNEVLNQMATGKHQIQTQADGGQQAEAAKPFKNVGDQLMAIAAAYTTGKADSRLGLIMAAALGSSEGVPSDGGFLLQQDFTTALLEATISGSELASRCRRIPIGPGANGLKAPIKDETSRATGSRWGGVQIYRANEAGTATAKKPKFGLIDTRLEKIIGICYLTDEIMTDVSALQAWVTMAFADEFDWVIDDEIMNGDGVGKCLGLLNAPALVTVAKETGQLAKTIQVENLDNMFSRMLARGLSKAAWFINQDVWPQLFGLTRGTGLAGVPVFTPPNGIAGAPMGMIHGRPIVPIEQCQTLGTKGDIVFADLSQYLLIDKGGVKQDVSIHVQFLTDETAFRFVVRINGEPLIRKAITPANGTNTQSPFVALASR